MEKGQVHRISGAMLRAMLDEAGFKYAMFCRYLQRRKASGWEGLASWTGLQRLFAERWIEPRYVEELKQFLGEKLFMRGIKKLGAEKKFADDIERI